MSNPDSFIDEVAEEVRRDRLFRLGRRYGWIGIALVLAIVGGAGWREYDSARKTTAARALGDALLAATEVADPTARQTALEAVSTLDSASPDGQALATLMRAADVAGLMLAAGAGADATAKAEAERLRDAVLADLAALAETGAVSEALRDIAMLRWHLLAPPELPGPGGADRRAVLEGLAQPGRTLRPLALEQLALLDFTAGDREAAGARLAELIADAQTPAALQRRAGDLRLALGFDGADAATGATPSGTTP